MSDKYIVWSPGYGEIGGGISLEEPTTDGQTSGTVVYIEVESIEDTLEVIESAGGKMLNPKTLISEEYGFFALFADPSGVCIGLWSIT